MVVERRVAGPPTTPSSWRSRQLQAISKTRAVIEFKLDGTVITANDNFLNAVGYTLDEVVGQHHRTFVDPAYGRARSTASSGNAEPRRVIADEFRRSARVASEVWLRPSHNAVLGSRR